MFILCKFLIAIFIYRSVCKVYAQESIQKQDDISSKETDSMRLAYHFQQLPNSWGDYHELLEEQIKNIEIVSKSNQDENIIFMLLHEARNFNEFKSMTINNLTEDFNLSKAIIRYIISLNTFDKFDLNFIYYYHGMSKLILCSVSKEILLQSSGQFSCRFAPDFSLEQTLELYSFTPNPSYKTLDITQSHDGMKSKIHMILDTRQNSQIIVDENLKKKLWHRYTSIDYLLDNIRKSYDNAKYPHFVYALQNNDNFASDAFTKTHHDNKQISYQESEYYLTSTSMYPSCDYWITMSDIVIYSTSKLNDVIDELSHYNEHSKVIIFIDTSIFLPYINFLKNVKFSFLLITNSNWDYTVPYFKSPQSEINIKVQIDVLLNHNKLIKWYTKNPSIYHPKLKPLPLGPKFQFATTMFFGESKQSIIDNLNKYCLTPYENFINHQLKTNLLYFNFMNASTNNPYYSLHKNMRPQLYETLIKNNFNYVNKSTFDEYLSVLSTYRYCMSPPGKGIDTHRTWECLMVGTIPILIHSPIDSLYDDLPVLIVNMEDIHQITEEYLNKKYIEIFNNKDKYNFEKLYTPYWKKEILSNLKVTK